ncbi:epithelial sodium channel subunit beta-like [Amphiura filiformis]|uniref:epithelial sodium channel subunit beta-like n=1 Tax=Amphiura filiformis TaxID=82378 RepID=UPI003B228265
MTKTQLKDNGQSIGSIFWPAFRNSSAHGLPNIYQNKSVILKLTWAILFLAAVGVVLWQVTELVKTFVAFNYQVSLDVRFNKTVVFPAVTICNINPTLSSKLVELDNQFRELFDKEYVGDVEADDDITDLTYFADDSNYTPESTTESASMQPAENMTDEAILSWEERESQGFFKTMSEEFKTRQMLITLLANKTLEERQEIGHQLDDMLLSCEWKGYPCSPGNFTQFYHYKYGNCYTFNSNMFGHSTQLYTNRPGPLYGLSLELNAQQGEYMQGITATAGFKVVIHSPNEMPFPEDHGLSISPGFETSIGVRVVDIARLEKPWADCVYSIKKDIPFEDFYTDNYGVDYSMKTCERSCYQWEVLKNCGCANPKYPFSSNSSEKICSLSGDIADLETIVCVQAVDRIYIAGELGCEKYCPHRCNERSYVPAMSQSVWPATKYASTLKERMLNMNQETRRQMRGASPNTWIKDNAARILVYYQEFNYEFIEQKPSYGVIDLLSDIGGQLGLWIGVSILTLCEMAESVCVILAFVFRKVFHCGKNRVKSTPTHVLSRDAEKVPPTSPAYNINRSPPPTYETSQFY